VGFVQDDEIVGKEIARMSIFHFAQIFEGEKEEGVVYDNEVGGQQLLASLLIETAAVRSTSFRGANVRLAANLRPDAWVGLNVQIAEGSLSCFLAPVPDPEEFLLLCGCEQVILELQRPLEAIWTKIVLPALEKRGFKRTNQPAHNRDIFVQQLFLEADRMGRNNRLSTMFQRKENGWYQVCQRLPNTRPRLNHEMATFLESAGYR
jgi:hypothetical protein